MEWWLIVLGTNLLTASIFLSLGLFMPRAIAIDYFLNYLLLIYILIAGVVGIVATAYGLKKR